MSEIDPYSYEFERKLLSSIKKRDGAVTVADVSTDTGLPYNQTEIGLRHLLELYESHLDVDDDGNLRYRFIQPMNRRGSNTIPLLYKIKDVIWGILRWIFKVWTMVMLVGYTIAFILLFVALMVVQSSQRDDSRRDSGLGGFYLLSRLLDYLFWFQITSPSRYEYERYGGQNNFISENGGRHATDAPFYEKVNRFVFGPIKKELSAEEKQQQFAQFVRERKGIVTAADWAEHTGLSLQEADSALTEGIVRFAGDVAVTPDGTLLYKFDEMKVTADENQMKNRLNKKEALRPIWEQPIENSEFTGNSVAANIGIAVMGVFIFFASNYCLTLASSLPPNLRPSLFVDFLTSPAFPVVMGWIPLLYSILFLLIPLMRLVPYLIRKGKGAVEENRREGIRKVFTSVKNGVAKSVDLKGYPDKKLALAYEGEVDIESGVPTIYQFETLANQRYAAETARDSSERSIVFGKTIYSSDDELYDEAQGELDDFDAMVANELGKDEKFAEKEVVQEEVSRL